MRPRLGLLLVSGLAASVAAHGCASQDEDVSAGLFQEVPLTSFCTELADALCEARGGCECFDSAALSLCQALERASCEAMVDSRVDQDQQSYDGVAAADCVRDIPSLLMADCAHAPAEWPARCGEVFSGSGQIGSTCSDVAPCEEGLTCGLGTCVVLPDAGEPCDPAIGCAPGARCSAGICSPARDQGEVCTASDECDESVGEQGLYCAPDFQCTARGDLDDPCIILPGSQAAGVVKDSCGEGLFCDDLLSEPVCSAPRLAGDSCNHDRECAADLFCDTMGPTTSPTCAARGVLDAPCQDNRQCADGFYCFWNWQQSEAGRCALVSELGEPCSRSSSLSCGTERYCKAAMSCEPTPALDEPCDPSAVPACGPGLVCDGFDPDGPICRELPAADQPCVAGVCDELSYCDGAECQARLAVGETCDDNQPCVAGAFCDPTPPRACTLLPGVVDAPCDFMNGCAAGLYCATDQQCAALVGIGGPCADASSCAAGLYCTMDQECAVLPTAGQSCESVYACAEGLYCDSEDNQYLCKLLPTEGQDCSVSYACASGSSCASRGVCEVRLQAGDSCEVGMEDCAQGLVCPDGTCAEGCSYEMECYAGATATCDASSHCTTESICAPALSNGETCIPWDCIDPCGPSSYCGGASTCEPFSAGALCDQWAGCPTGYYCASSIDGTGPVGCQPLGALGDPCGSGIAPIGSPWQPSESTCLDGLWCRLDDLATGTCAEKLADGEPCEPLNENPCLGECVAGLCTGAAAVGVCSRDVRPF